MAISFTVSSEDLSLIEQIAKRAEDMAGNYLSPSPITPMELIMDLTACHANGCPLNLKVLLEAPRAELAHDVFGIRAHINRETGRLGNCFLPRCAK